MLGPQFLDLRQGIVHLAGVESLKDLFVGRDRRDMFLFAAALVPAPAGDQQQADDDGHHDGGSVFPQPALERLPLFFFRKQIHSYTSSGIRQ